MSAKTFVTFLFVVVLSLFIVMAVSAASLAPVSAVDNLFQAINAGELERASALFAPEAVAHNIISDVIYEGSEEIGHLLEGMQRTGRIYEIVQLEMVDDTVEFTVEISDRGLVWAQQSMTAEVQKDRITNFEVHQIQLQLWRVWD